MTRLPDISDAALRAIAPGFSLSALGVEVCEPRLDPATLVRMRQGKRQPTPEHVERIILALDRARVLAAEGHWARGRRGRPPIP